MKTIKGQTTIRLPVELKNILKQEANRLGYSLKDMVTFILYQYFQNIERQ